MGKIDKGEEEKKKVLDLAHAFVMRIGHQCPVAIMQKYYAVGGVKCYGTTMCLHHWTTLQRTHECGVRN